MEADSFYPVLVLNSGKIGFEYLDLDEIKLLENFENSRGFLRITTTASYRDKNGATIMYVAYKYTKNRPMRQYRNDISFRKFIAYVKNKTTRSRNNVVILKYYDDQFTTIGYDDPLYKSVLD